MVDIGKFEKEIKNLKEYVILATVSPQKYQQTNLELVKNLTKKQNIPGVYVTLNKPYKTMEALFKKSNINTNLLILLNKQGL